ncbi:MAG TPA: hypothetical protein VFU47_01595, partial [Armatimonadota bacterium]|nr:hypothetical protein [Armatimonadota bacterium]
MPVVIAPQFGDYVYEANDVVVEEWSDDSAVRGAIAPVPRSDIARELDGFLAPRQVSIRGTLGPDGGGTRDQLRAVVDAFMWAHRAGLRRLYKEEDRYVTAEVRSLTLGQDQGFGWMPFSLRLEAGDPFYYATAADTDNWAGPANGGTRVLANGGAATALPQFTITIGSTGTLALDLFNDTRAADNTFGLDGAVTAGDVLVVDC